MLSNVGKLACLIFLLARIGVICAQSVADTYESASATVSVTSSTAGQYYVAPTGRDCKMAPRLIHGRQSRTRLR